MARTNTETTRAGGPGEIPAPPRGGRTWGTVVATFFGIGYFKPGPGTWASVATVLLWRGLAPFAAPQARLWAAIAASVGVTILGIPASTRAARALGRKDPSQVVIDEVAGQMIAMIGAALGWRSLLAALILFRVFDITKPFPLRRLEYLPEGWGIMLDDVGAGLYALALMAVARHFGWL